MSKDPDLPWYPEFLSPTFYPWESYKNRNANFPASFSTVLFLLFLAPFLPFETLERESLHLSLYMFAFPKHLLQNAEF